MPTPRANKSPDPQALEQHTTNAFDLTDVMRRLGLDYSERIEAVKAANLVRERKRLVAVKGPDADEVKHLDARIAAHSAAQAVVRADAQRARTPPIVLTRDRTMIHGRVVDQDRLGIPKLIVVATDARSKPAARDMTDTNGYFRIELSPATRPA